MLKPNPFGWVSIPATDVPRAVAFYNEVFDLSLEITDYMGTSMAFFQGDQSAYGATGAISPAPPNPGTDGAVPFFACASDLGEALGRIEDAGGTVIVPKTPIGEFGFIAQFHDSEGNLIGLHSAS